jgi:hypothetical protein
MTHALDRAVGTVNEEALTAFIECFIEFIFENNLQAERLQNFVPLQTEGRNLEKDKKGR